VEEEVAEDVPIHTADPLVVMLEHQALDVHVCAFGEVLDVALATKIFDENCLR
jgi:hypothetical protein